MTGHRTTPWTAAQARAVVVCDVIAAVVVLWAARGGAAQDSLGDQILWINVAVVALVAVMVANGYLFLHGRRAVGKRRIRVLPDVVQRPPATRAGDPDRWLWIPGTIRAHVAGCPMVAGKTVESIEAPDVRAKRLTRCEVCR